MEWQKLAFFVHCFVSTCLANQPTTVLELGLSVALFELNRTIWQDFFAFLWFILPRATFLVTSYILLSWNKETPLVKSNFLSSQMVSHSFSPSSLPLHKAKWVQLNGKTLQVLKKNLLQQIWPSLRMEGFQKNLLSVCRYDKCNFKPKYIKIFVVYSQVPNKRVLA